MNVYMRLTLFIVVSVSSLLLLYTCGKLNRAYYYDYLVKLCIIVGCITYIVTGTAVFWIVT